MKPTSLILSQSPEFTAEQTRQLNKSFRAIETALSQSGANPVENLKASGVAVRTGLWASRTGKIGDFFWATDRTVLVMRTTSGWQYIAGEMRGTLDPDTKPVDLTASDVGFRFYATDYVHKYRWTGGAWTFAPGDAGSGFIVAREPYGGKWAPCTGGSVKVANDNGVLIDVVTPDLTGDVFLLGAGASSVQKAATKPTWAAGKTTTGAASGTTWASGTGALGPYGAHTHDVSGTEMNPPSEANGGLPLRIALVWYIRQ